MKKEQIVSPDPRVLHGPLVFLVLAYQLKA